MDGGNTAAARIDTGAKQKGEPGDVNAELRTGGRCKAEASAETRPNQQDSSQEGSHSKTKEGFMIAIDTSKTSIVDSLVSLAAAEASFVPGRWQRSFRRLGEEEGSMGL